MKRIDTTILKGDRVRYKPDYLERTGQFVDTPGPEAPCSWGPRARGIVLDRDRRRLAHVRWEDGLVTTVLVQYLERVGYDE